MQIIKQIALVFIGGGSDKAYNATLLQTGDNAYVVNFEYGRRGATLTLGTKTSSPVTLDKAEKIYEKLIAEKRGKGYDVPEKFGLPASLANHNSAAFIPAKEDSGVLPQLLNAILAAEVAHSLRHPNFVMQEKHDGRRMLLRKRGESITAINRKGQIIATPVEFVTGAKYLPGDCLLDGEAVGTIFFVFDILELNGQNLRDQPYLSRVRNFARIPTGSIRAVTTAIEPETKEQHFALLEKQGAEGVVFKNANAPYTPGRPNSGGPQLKYKFVQSATCVVKAINEQRSVQLEMLDGTTRKFVGNVTIPANHGLPTIGTTVEVRYLYAYRDGALYQPVYLGERDDVDCDDVSSLKYKAV